MIVLYQSHEGHHCPPSDHNAGQPHTWTKPLQHHVAWHFERRIRKEKHGQAPVILVWGKTQINIKPLDLGVSNVAALLNT
jgi:hypothetical protein